MNKILIITDSGANPRVFPLSEKVELEETYPYLLRNEFKDSIFWQLSIGNIETSKMTDQVISYLSNWDPDFIIVHSGMADCRPESFSEFQKLIIYNIFSLIPSKIKKYLKLPSPQSLIYSSKLIKKRHVERVSKKDFKKNIKKFLLIFVKTKVVWLEISAEPKYEKIRPGVMQRIKDYNEILIKELPEDRFVYIYKSLLKQNGYNNDGIHLNKLGHQTIANILIKKMKLN